MTRISKIQRVYRALAVQNSNMHDASFRAKRDWIGSVARRGNVAGFQTKEAANSHIATHTRPMCRAVPVRRNALSISGG